MQVITITEYSYNIDFQAFVNGLSYVASGETIVVRTFDNITKIITKN